MNNEIKITDYYYHLDFLLNELTAVSLLLSHYKRKAQDEDVFDNLDNQIFIEMCQTIKFMLFDRTQEIGRIIGHIYEKRQMLLSQPDKKLFKILMLDINNKLEISAIEKLQCIANYLQFIDIMFKNAQFIKSLTGMLVEHNTLHSKLDSEIPQDMWQLFGKELF